MGSCQKDFRERGHTRDTLWFENKPVSPKDLTAPSEGLSAASYTVTVIQSQQEKPSVNQGSRSQWT